MKSTSIQCDHCGRAVRDAKQSIALRLDQTREPDPSGNGYSTNCREFDMCLDCATELLQTAVNNGQLSL